MNVQQSAMAMVIHGNSKGKLAFVLWQEAVHPELGTMWKVRFQEPTLSTRISADGGATFQDGIAFGRDALMPDAWLRAVERHGSTQLNIDLHRPVLPPEVLDAELRWPDGWLSEVRPG
jgi:hypothetical protein